MYHVLSCITIIIVQTIYILYNFLLVQLVYDLNNEIASYPSPSAPC